MEASFVKGKKSITNYKTIEIFENEDIGFGIDGCGLPAINLNVTNFLNSIKFMQIKFMQNKIGESFSGIISGVSDWGIYVEIEENKCEGMVYIKDIEDDKIPELEKFIEFIQNNPR